MSSSAVEEIKARLDLAEVVSQTVQLRPSGRNLKGLCPFHTEKTPSFYLFTESGGWHCFGCNEGGDVFTFVMKRDRLEFVEALRDLAARAGVTLPSAGQSPVAREEHERLYQALEAAALYYQALLAQRAGQAGREYLERRAVSAEMQQQFGLGYAPEQSGALQRYLREKGYSTDDMLAAGVVGRGAAGDTYDLLRGRVVFPIRDVQSRVIALAGRALADAVQPKYLNTPQTALFDKGSCLYALDLARPAIRQGGQVVIVEGYLDAIAAHQQSFRNVVATMGTAITERHLALLKRGGPEIVLALDADEAGQTAALRALEVASQTLGDAMVPVPSRRGSIRYQASGSSRLKVAVLPAGKDPDDLLHQDASAWGALVAAALPVVDFVLSRLGARHRLDAPDGKAAAADEALAAIAEVPDPVERAHYLQKLSALLQVDEAVLAEKAGRRRAPRSAGGQPARAPRVDTLEEYVLALIAAGGVPELVDLQSADFRHPAHRALFGAIVGAGSGGDVAPDATGGRHSTAHARIDPTSFGEALAAELQPAWTTVSAHSGTLEALSAEQLKLERECTALELRHRRLLDEHERVRALLEGEGPEDQAVSRADWLQKLHELTLSIGQVERLRLQHGRIGSMVPRYRHAMEMLRG